MRKLLSTLLIIAMVLPMMVTLMPIIAVAEQDNGGEVDITGCTAISTADEFVKMAKDGGKYYLANDIDLTGKTLAPNGWPGSEAAHNVFSNFLLEGNNKTITIDRPIFNILQNAEIRNLTIEGSICYQNRNVAGRTSASPFYMSPLTSETHNGSYSACAPGKVTLKYVTSKVTMTGVQEFNLKYMSGVISSVGAGSVFDHVKYEGTIKAEFLAGQYWESGELTNSTVSKFETIAGICGRVTGGDATFTNCETEGSITLTSDVTSGNASNGGIGGILGAIGTKDNTHVSFVNCVNNMDITNNSPSTNFNVGGILGHVVMAGTTSVDFENCVNNGDLTGMQVGGMAGYAANLASLTMENCTNNGDIKCTGRGYKNATGGLISRASCDTVTITDCTNTGNITVTAQNGIVHLGGIIGAINGLSTNEVQYNITGCVNTGNITSSRTYGGVEDEGTGTGGIIGCVWGVAKKGMVRLTVRNCQNDGNITTNPQNAQTTAFEQRGGIVGYTAMVRYLTIEYCTNNGDIIATKDGAAWNAGTGGILGTTRCFGVYSGADDLDYRDSGGTYENSLQSTYRIASCINNGNITATYNVAGICANINSSGTYSTFTVNTCINNGDITSVGNYDSYTNNVAGGIMGGADALYKGPYVYYQYCLNNGNVKAMDSAGGIVGDYRLSKVALTNSVNAGRVEATDGGVSGGLIGLAAIPADVTGVEERKLHFIGCANVGEVIGATLAGGFVGKTDGALEAPNGVSAGAVKQAGGQGYAIAANTNGGAIDASTAVYLVDIAANAYTNGALKGTKAAVEDKINSLTSLPAYDIADLKENYDYVNNVLKDFDYPPAVKTTLDSLMSTAEGLLSNQLTAKQANVNKTNAALYNAMWSYNDNSSYIVTIPATLNTSKSETISLEANGFNSISSISVTLKQGTQFLQNSQGDTIEYQLKLDGVVINNGDVVMSADMNNPQASGQISANVINAENAPQGRYTGVVSFVAQFSSGKYDTTSDDAMVASSTLALDGGSALAEGVIVPAFDAASASLAWNTYSKNKTLREELMI